MTQLETSTLQSLLTTLSPFCPESFTINDFKVFLSGYYKFRDLGEVE